MPRQLWVAPAYDLILLMYNHPRCRLVTVRSVPRRRERPPQSEPPVDPFTALGLSGDADEDAVLAARRRLAKRAHPDAGGSVEAMQQLNVHARRALDHIRTLRASALGRPAQRPGTTPSGGSRRPSPRPEPTPAGTRRDHPSFTIEVLPVEAFEGLLIVASWLGTPIHDDPPYLLEVALTEPVRGWCRLEIVPDAGASSVSLAVAAEPGYGAPDVFAVRDAWIDGLNRLDWADLDASLPPS